MTMHPTPAERLLAILGDEPAIETLPAGEIHADLNAVGVDPARCVAFARTLATGGNSPGGRLLGAIDMAEDAEDEIARLESADIGEVRARIPEGTAAAIAAEARRMAGADSNVVAMKTRRRRILLWGGPAAGIAASVLLFVVVGVQFLDSKLQETSYYTAAPAGGDLAEMAEQKDEATVGGKPEAEKRKLDLESDVVELPRELAKPALRAAEEAPVVAAAPPAPEPPADVAANFEETIVLQDKGFVDTARQEGAAALTAEGNAGAEGLLSRAAPATDAFGYSADEKANDARTRKAAAPAIDAMVIFDGSQVPLAVQSQALTDPGLSGRIDEARRLAGDRPVIALYRVRTGDGRQDFAQLPLQPGKSQQRAAPSPLVELLGADAAGYDFIALPER